ncbi:MAG: AAA family ATPase [Desulfobacteraceae bacterium]|nr:AAA family ATPase [Desulfobacteraceae bacterium]
MNYFRLFNLEKEPFANTPDPDFFYRSTRHAECLQKVELAVRLKRGLCIVRGEIGTGKTTLCRQLIRMLSDDPAIQTHLVMDPGYESTEDFAANVCEMIAGRDKARACSGLAGCREAIKDRLFEAGVDGGKTIVLIIDEGQKLSAGCAEFLRELLNYETNEHKLLQIVIFAQNEIVELLDSHPGFADRAALYHQLYPLNRKDTARLINHRLEKAGSPEKKGPGPVFTKRALSRIYRISKGYPRTVIHIAHNILLLMLIKGGKRVTPAIVSRSAAGLPDVKKGELSRTRLKKTALAAATAGILLAVMAAYTYWPAIPGPEQNNAAGIPEKKIDNKHAAAASVLPAARQGPAGKPEKKPPEILGEITINEKDRLWQMLAALYGPENTPLFMKKVQEANSNIQNPNLIRPGQEVVFPAAEAAAVPEKHRYRIAWKESGDLNSVYRFAAQEQPGGLRIISFWHPDFGIKHAAVEKNPFALESQARQQIEDRGENREKKPFVLDLSRDGLRLLTGLNKG